jgi:alkylated DNA repair dioxygenase AlkB
VSSDLFGERLGFERIPIVDGDLYYLHHLELGRSAGDIMEELIAVVPWRSEVITVWGKTYEQPRLIAWYGDPGRRYSYSGIEMTPLPWTKLLLDIRTKIQSVSNASFNSVLLNYYRDNRDSMGFHSDDEPELGARPVIASLSVGAERMFVLKHKWKKGTKSVRLRLGSSSVLLMEGDTQRNWQHGIPKESRKCGPRINLTFRQILM